MTDIEQPHRAAYDHGTDPIDWAVQMIVNHMEVQQDVPTARAQDPSAFPNVRFDLDNASVARRALATLLDAGWTPPHLGRPDPDQGGHTMTTPDPTGPDREGVNMTHQRRSERLTDPTPTTSTPEVSSAAYGHARSVKRPSPPPPDRWQLPPEPDVTQLQDATGCQWRRDPAGWTRVDEADDPTWRGWPWWRLLVQRGPLTAAPAARDTADD